MKTCVIIPTLNEEEGIAKTIKSIPKGYDIFLVDGLSKDNTVKIAKDLGAKIIFYKKLGKGNAMKKALKMLDYDAYVFMDGDGTYNGKYIPALVRSLSKGYDLAIASRFLGKGKGFSPFRYITNKFFTKVLNLLNSSNITDISTGLRAVTKKFVKNIKLKEGDFKIETEMTIKALKKGYKIYEILVRYEKRLGRSKIKLIDMMKIFLYGIKESLK